jgi:hypothetical protein
MPEIVADAPSLSCSLLLSEGGIQGSQSLSPDPFSPRARDARGRFAKGSSGNPRGRPRGIRNPRRRVPDLVARPLSPQVLSNLLDRKPHLLRPLAAQLLPPPLAPIDPAERLGIDLSSLRTIEHFRELLPEILAAIARGQITPAEGACIARRVRARLRAIRRRTRFERRFAHETVPSGRRSGCGRTRLLQRRCPPQQVIDHRLGRSLEFRQSRIHITALEVRPEGRSRYVDGRANWSELKLYRRFAELLDAARARGTAIAHESRRLAVPLRIYPVERILEHRSGAVVIFWRDKDEAVRPGNLGSPLFDDFILVRRATRHRGRHGLVEERHRKVSEVEQLRVDTAALLEMLENPPRRRFRKTTLAGASDDHRNNSHVLLIKEG